MEAKKYVLGIDPSLTGMGVAKYFDDGSHDVKRFKSKSLGETVRERNLRYLRLIDRVMSFIGVDDGDLPPVVICLEGYSFGSVGRAVSLGELGGILRSDLCLFDDVPIYEVAPNALKKFVTGKGVGDKIAVVTSCLKNWNVGFSSDDEFDAYGLSRIAACIAGFNPPENIQQVQCLKKITNRVFEVGESTLIPEPESPPF